LLKPFILMNKLQSLCQDFVFHIWNWLLRELVVQGQIQGYEIKRGTEGECESRPCSTVQVPEV
jgi:hypothetical protein